MVFTFALILLICVLGEAAATAEVGAGVVKQFKAHLAEHNIQIPEHEFVWRTRIFADNLRRIDELNAKHHPHTQFGTNQFSHLAAEEILSKFTSEYTPSNYSGNVHEKVKRQSVSADDFFDWRIHGKVTPVKARTEGLAVPAYGVVAVIESINAIKRTHLVSLSEQQIIDCVEEANFFNAFNYVADSEEPGLVTETDYPYRSDTKGDCEVPESAFHVSINSILMIEPSEDGIEDAVRNYGPVAVRIHVTDAFFSYKGGILTPDNCTEHSHAVAVVGFGSENGQDYWIIKNNWGPEWGEEGYFRLRRNQNTCNIAQEPMSASIFY